MWLKPLRAIASFLNTDGGILLIGVEDNGEITGIEELENFKSNNEFLETFSNKINAHLSPLPGRSLETCIALSPYGKSVCMVKCKARQIPTRFLAKGQDILLVRNLNSSRPLTDEEGLHQRAFFAGED